MGPLLGQVLPLALGAAISPLLFLLQLSTLTGKRPFARGAMLVAGAAIPLAAMGAIGVLLGSRTSLAGHPTVKASVDIGLGALLLALAARTVLRPPPPPKAKPDHDPSLRRSFLLGAAAMVTNFTTFALYIPALKLIVESEVETAEKALATILVLVVTLSLALVPLLLVAVVPGSTRALEALGAFMTRHHRTLNVVICVGFGSWLLVRGLTAL